MREATVKLDRRRLTAVLALLAVGGALLMARALVAEPVMRGATSDVDTDEVNPASDVVNTPSGDVFAIRGPVNRTNDSVNTPVDASGAPTSEVPANLPELTGAPNLINADVTATAISQAPQRRAHTPQIPDTASHFTAPHEEAPASDTLVHTDNTQASPLVKITNVNNTTDAVNNQKNIVNTTSEVVNTPPDPVAAVTTLSPSEGVTLSATSPPGTQVTLTTVATPDAPTVNTSAAQPAQFNAPSEPLPANPIERRGPFEIIDASGELSVVLRRSKLLRTTVDIYRTAVVDPRVCNVVQFTPREVSVIGQGLGATHVTFWFEDGKHEPLTYLVRVVPDPEVQDQREKQYHVLEEMIAELFPDSKVHLVPISDKILVKGQARDAEEAAQIMAVIRGQAIWGNFQSGAGYGSIVQGSAAPALIGQEDAARVPAGQVINMLKIPGEQQVMLRVKIAELNRTAAKNFGVDLDINVDDGKLVIQSMLNAASGSAASILGMYDDEDINFGIHYLEQHGVVRLLSEPTLVTLSGRPATFLAGGEFAVPTTVGVGGAAAVTTDFRAFGAIVTFMPVVLDKDLIRLQVAPSFSQVNNKLAVGNTPGLNTRAVTTTVEMREGQTLAIAGLLDDAMTGNLQGDLPWVVRLFGRRSISRNETELMIMVTPELVHPLDPEEVPPLPGFDVTEPTKTQFYLKGQLEGTPTSEYRSTIWPRLRERYTHDGPAMISGPFGHGR